jgi:hypothetical protein
MRGEIYISNGNYTGGGGWKNALHSLIVGASNDGPLSSGTAFVTLTGTCIAPDQISTEWFGPDSDVLFSVDAITTAVDEGLYYYKVTDAYGNTGRADTLVLRIP